MSNPFKDPSHVDHKEEVVNRWGNTTAYKQSMAKVARMSAADLARIKAEAETITQKTADLMNQGLAVESREVQQQMDLFYRHLRNFYEPNMEMFKGLGQMYVSDPRFSQVYEKRAKGFAQFMKDAMTFYADSQLASS